MSGLRHKLYGLPSSVFQIEVPGLLSVYRPNDKWPSQVWWDEHKFLGRVMLEILKPPILGIYVALNFLTTSGALAADLKGALSQQLRAKQNSAAGKFPSIKEVIRDIAMASAWWRQRIPPQRPGGWINYYDATNIKTRATEVVMGTPYKGEPILESSEVYAVSNCSSSERAIDQELKTSVQSVVSVSMTDGFTQENEVNFNVGTNPNAQAFLAANLALSQKITINLTSNQTKQETSSKDITWKENRGVAPHTYLSIFVEKTESISYLPFSAKVQIDADLNVEWYNPAGASGSAHVRGWRPLTLFAPSLEERTRQVEGIVGSGTTTTTNIVYREKKLAETDPVCAIK